MLCDVSERYYSDISEVALGVLGVWGIGSVWGSKGIERDRERFSQYIHTLRDFLRTEQMGATPGLWVNHSDLHARPIIRISGSTS